MAMFLYFYYCPCKKCLETIDAIRIVASRNDFVYCDFIQQKENPYLVVTTYEKEIGRYFGLDEIENYIKRIYS